MAVMLSIFIVAAEHFSYMYTHHNIGEPGARCCAVGGLAERAELHYTVFNPGFRLPVGGLVSEVDPAVDEDVLTISKNKTQGIEDALSPEQQGLSANVTGSDRR
jgi:hypothetical protein